MLTLFTCPKSFLGWSHINVIQRNALESWKRLEPHPQIILMGDDPGVAEVAEEFGFDYVPDIARNEYGTPLVSDIFAQAERHAKHDTLCYINADMILNTDFLRALSFVASQKRPFLMVSQRWNLDITEPLDFNAPGWEQTWPDWVKSHGKIDLPSAIDFFAFSKGLYKDMPAFAIGRTLWDNWLLFGARQRNAILVDSTPVVVLAHQNHDYAHVTSKPGDAYHGPERDRNFELLGDTARIFTMDNSTHRLFTGPNGFQMKSTFRIQRLGQIIHELSTTKESFRALGKVARGISQVGKRLKSR